MTTCDNEWQQVVQRMATNDKKWHNEWQRVATNDSESQQITTSEQWMTTSGITNYKESQRIITSGPTMKTNENKWEHIKEEIWEI